jgi:hypothetical protein
MATITAGEVRECCQTGSNLRLVEDTPQLTIRQCVAPAADGLVELDGVRVCGRRHFRAKLIGLGARAAGARLGD